MARRSPIGRCGRRDGPPITSWHQTLGPVKPDAPPPLGYRFDPRDPAPAAR
jgi:hypothetical protein